MTVRDLTILGCSSQQPTRYRNQSAYLLRWNGKGFLFDPGEGTQRQFIFANIAPTVVTYILISHFHGDHCLGLGSMLMRLNLDKVTHPIHCFYPASGKKYFDRLRYGTIYHEMINVIEHPVSEDGIVYQEDGFTIEAAFLEHGVDNVGWRITEADTRKFNKDKLASLGLYGPLIKELQNKGSLVVEGKEIHLDEVSYIRKGDTFSVVIDTLYCPNALKLARDATMLLCESTYMEAEHTLAINHKHLTCIQAATLAKEANAKELILTHFSARYQNAKEMEKEARTVFPNTSAAEDFLTFPFAKNAVDLIKRG